MIGVAGGRFRLTPDGTDDLRLQDIASRTGGAYFRNVTADQLGPVLDTIDSLALACGTALPTAATAAAAPKATPTTSDLQGAKAPSLSRNVSGAVRAALPRTAHVTPKRPYARFTTDLSTSPGAIDVTLDWKRPSIRFDVSSLKVVSFTGRTTSIPAAAVRRAVRGVSVRSGGMTIRGSRGKTYISLHIAGVGSALARTAARPHIATKRNACAQTELKERLRRSSSTRVTRGTCTPGPARWSACP